MHIIYDGIHRAPWNEFSRTNERFDKVITANAMKTQDLTTATAPRKENARTMLKLKYEIHDCFVCLSLRFSQRFGGKSIGYLSNQYLTSIICKH